jgi:hypothetical protein
MAKRERMKKTKADQWINLDEVWWMTRMGCISHCAKG